MSLGLKQAGFNKVFSCDYKLDCVKTIGLNFPKVPSIHCDIRELSNEKILSLIGKKKIHLVAGGPPCQGFSTIGKGDPKDIRNNLFKEFVRVVKLTEPEFVLFENVTGLLSRKNEKTFNAIVKSFSVLGYKMQVKVVQTQKFGVPQKRRRAILVGMKEGRNFSYPEETHDIEIGRKYVRPQNLGDVLKKIVGKRERDLNHDLESTQIKSKMDRERLKRIPEGCSIRYQKDEKKFLTKKLSLGVNWDEIREGRLRENHYHRLSRNLPTPTINTHNHHYYHPVELRKFTLREFALMQSFPLSYKFYGSRTSIVRQIGNAVPPLLAKRLGESILCALRSKKSVRKSKYSSKSDFEKLRSEAFVY